MAWLAMCLRSRKPGRRTAGSWSADKTVRHSWPLRSSLPPGRCTGKTVRFGSITMSSPSLRMRRSPERWHTRWRGSLPSRRGRTVRCLSPPTRTPNTSIPTSSSTRCAGRAAKCSGRGRIPFAACGSCRMSCVESMDSLSCRSRRKNSPKVWAPGSTAPPSKARAGSSAC